MKYKFITSILLLLVWAYIPVCAQTLSFEGGYLATKYSNMPPFANNKGGFQLGVGYAVPVGDSVLYFKTGINYLQLDGRGAINYYNQINQIVLSYEKNQEIYYLQIPLLLQSDIFKIKQIQFSIEGGLHYNFLLRAWHNPQRVGVQHNVTSQFNRHVLGYLGALNAVIPTKAPYNIQFTYIYAGSITNIKSNENTAFNVHSFLCGIKFKL